MKVGWMDTLGQVVGNVFFRVLFGFLPEINLILSNVVWKWVIRPMFRPTTACPNISSGGGGDYGRLLGAALDFNAFFLQSVVTPLILLGIIFIGVLFLFGHWLDLREKIKNATPKFIFAVILAYTTEIWMDLLLDLGRGLLSTVYGALPSWIGFRGLVGTLFVGSTGEGFGENFASVGAYFLLTMIVTMIIVAIGISLLVRLSVIYVGISIMPIMSVLLGIPFLDAVGKKFIKIWIQSIFFIFFMSIPLILMSYTDGWMRIGLLIVTLGMPFLVSSGEVLAMRAGGFQSAGSTVQRSIMGGELGTLLSSDKGGPAGSIMGGSDNDDEEGGMNGKLGMIVTGADPSFVAGKLTEMIKGGGDSVDGDQLCGINDSNSPDSDGTGEALAEEAVAA